MFIIDGAELAFVVKDTPEAVFCDVTRVSDLDFAYEGAPVHLMNNGCEEAQWEGIDVTGKVVVVDQTGYSTVGLGLVGPSIPSSSP